MPKRTTTSVMYGRTAEGDVGVFAAGGGYEVPKLSSESQVANALKIEGNITPVRMKHIRRGLEGVKAIDAEQKLLIYAAQEGITPLAIGTSRRICPWCINMIIGVGGMLPKQGKEFFKVLFKSATQ